MQRFEKDKKLDNRREPISATLLHLSFKYGDSRINVRKRKFVTRSGYCLDSNDGHLGVSITDIDEIQEWHGDGVISWEITTYPELKASALRKIINAVTKQKREWQSEVDKLIIPTPV